ncbi:hypothetical protein ACFV42_23130 [Streptomyces solisilvae]|uniref:hypothetical protein n=1 Tax=Streptomyces malaysiensis TaxID=92644 RepID=UPI0036AAADC0
MSTAEPEKDISAEEETEAEQPHLILMETMTAPAAPAGAAEPEDDLDREEQQDGEERDPGALSRAWIWFKNEWHEIVSVLEFREFLISSIEDVAVASRYLPRLACDWIFEPDPRTDDGALKKIGLRLVGVIGPLAGAVFVMLLPGGEIVMPFSLFALLIASWVVADDARMDAKLRKLARKKKQRNADRARMLRMAKKYGLSPQDIERLQEDEEEPRGERPAHQSEGSKVSLEKEPTDRDEGEDEGPRPWTEDDINKYVWAWVLEQIGEKNGIHLDVLFKAAQEKKDPPRLVEPTTVQSQFRKGLEYRMVKVDQVKVDGLNRTGVKKDWVPRA